MFIPLHDKNPRILIARPWVTWGLIAACAAIFAVQLSLGLRGQERLVYGLGLIPATLRDMVWIVSLIDERAPKPGRRGSYKERISN